MGRHDQALTQGISQGVLAVELQPWHTLERLIKECWVTVDEEGIHFKGGRNRPAIAERVEADAVVEYWVQRYVRSNPAQFGLEELAGPFETGPDFKGRLGDYTDVVDIEVEIKCQN